jgi:hypothetical protein
MNYKKIDANIMPFNRMRVQLSAVTLEKKQEINHSEGNIFPITEAKATRG